MGVVLREVIPDGTQWGQFGDTFPDWTNLEFGQDLKVSSSLSFSYPRYGTHVDRLKPGTYLCPVVDGSYKWGDSYFRIEDEEGSNTAGENSELKFSATSLRSRLGDMGWMPAWGSQWLDKDIFRYTNITPGNLVKAGVENWLSRAKKRFADPVDWLCNIVVSAAKEWDTTTDELLTPPVRVSEIISKYQDLGLLNVGFNGFWLYAYPYSKSVSGAAHDKTGSVELQGGFNLLQAEYQESIQDVYTAVLVKGGQDFLKQKEADACAWVAGPASAIKKWGYRETVLEVSDASNQATLQAIGKAYIAKHLEARYSTTYSMANAYVDGRSGKRIPTPDPLVDFQCGDLISIRDPLKGYRQERVYALGISYDNPTATPTTALTLNDFFESWEETFDQRLKRLEIW